MPDLNDRSLVPLNNQLQPAVGAPGERSLSTGFYEREEHIDLREYWRKIRKHKWLILVLTVIVTGLVTIQAYRTKSLYRAATTIEVGRQNTALIKDGAILLPSGDSDSINTHIQVLQSYSVLESTAARLKLDQRPRFLEIDQMKSGWEAVTTIADRFRPGRPKPAQTPVPPVNASVKKASGRPVILPEDSARLAPMVGVLSRNLTVEQVPGTRILSVSFTHTDPAIAVEVTETIAQDFIDRNSEVKSESFRNTSDWLDRTTRDLKARMEEAEQALVTYSREHNIFSTGGDKGGDLTAGKLADLHSQATKAEVERILKASLYEEVKNGRADKLPEAFADTKVSALQQKLSELTVQEAQLSVKFGSTNPALVAVRQQIASIEKQIGESREILKEKLKADYERAIREEKSLTEALDKAKLEASRQNQATIQYNILDQQAQITKTLYNDFLQKTNQASIAKADSTFSTSNIQILDHARLPGAPVGPNRLRAILIGLFMSLVAGAGLALLIEFLDNTVKTPEDVERLVHLPTLALIPVLAPVATVRKTRLLGTPRNGSGSDQYDTNVALSPGGFNTLAALDPRSSGAEAYRVLRTSILMSSAGQPPKTILFTSSQPGEGKSTTVINTAISLAQNGASVLVVDCDLRRPSLHKKLGLSNQTGLTSYLSRSISIDDLIHQLDVVQGMPMSNLSVVTAGPIPPNPAELLGSEHMRKLLRLFADCYDHVLIDSPPIVNVTDPLILSGMADGAILLIHGGKTPRETVRRAQHELASVGARIFGVVLNNLNLRREGYEYYYYHRYYSKYYSESERAQS